MYGMSVKSTAEDTSVVVPPTRLAVEKLAPAASRALNALDEAVRKTSIEPGLLDLVRLRASQINGCAYCVDMHSRDALAVGETERRVFALPVWRETPFFTARQRAALELAEAMTRLADCPVPDEIVDHAASQFSERELAELIWTITSNGRTERAYASLLAASADGTVARAGCSPASPASDPAPQFSETRCLPVHGKREVTRPRCATQSLRS